MVPVNPVVIEDSTVTTTSEFSTQAGAVNDYIICDGPGDIQFTITLRGGRNPTQTFTLKAGEVNDVPFAFVKLAWQAVSGTSAFRCFAHEL